MIKKSTLSLISFFFVINFHPSFGQSQLRYWSAGIFMSSQIHSGFISNGEFRLMPSPGFGVSLKSSYFNRIHLGIDAGFIRLKNKFENNENSQWNLSTSNIEILINTEINLRSFGKYMRKANTSPYIKLAPSFNIFQPNLTDIKDFTDDYEFYPYTYFSTGWYMGVGYKFRLKNDYLIQSEIFINNMFTSKASGFTLKDHFTYDRYIGIRLLYSFVKF